MVDATEQQVSRAINKMADWLSHEISEAKICLEEPANIRMALARLHQMERDIEQFRKGIL